MLISLTLFFKPLFPPTKPQKNPGTSLCGPTLFPTLWTYLSSVPQAEDILPK